jgi:uracil-DNA glycosylase family 4
MQIKKPKGSDMDAQAVTSLDLLMARVVACQQCPRLREYCAEIGRVKRRAYRDEVYWAKPVPSFGDPRARVLVLGLAPGAHGSNRTGRPFTGDGSGLFMYQRLYETGFASQASSKHLNDGLKLHSMWIAAVGRCAPPANKPLPAELRNCAPFLDEEIALLTNLRVIIGLGHIAWDGFLSHLQRTTDLKSKSTYKFGHGAEYKLPDGRWLLGCYHPSLQNTNTGRLTTPMMDKVFLRARELAGLK